MNSFAFEPFLLEILFKGNMSNLWNITLTLINTMHTFHVGSMLAYSFIRHLFLFFIRRNAIQTFCFWSMIALSLLFNFFTFFFLFAVHTVNTFAPRWMITFRGKMTFFYLFMGNLDFRLFLSFNILLLLPFHLYLNNSPVFEVWYIFYYLWVFLVYWLWVLSKEW